MRLDAAAARSSAAPSSGNMVIIHAPAQTQTNTADTTNVYRDFTDTTDLSVVASCLFHTAKFTELLVGLTERHNYGLVV